MRIFSKLKSALVKGSSDLTPKVHDMPPHQVDGPHYIIGDVHGRMDLLEQLCDQIVADAQARPGMEAAKIIYVGDYVDRGDTSAEVLSHLFELNQAQPDRHICLIGNHEVMMLQFLDDPIERGNRWLRYGGMQTMASFGIRGVRERMEPENLDHAAAQLKDVMPDGMIDWLRALPRTYQTGNVVVVHAGMDPALPVAEQSDRTLVWGHKDFMHANRADGLWVAHGHTIVDQARLSDGWMSLDTGAYATGRLTAVGLDETSIWLLQTSK